jgi:hypothetical protein
MWLNKLIEKWKDIVNAANARGIPLPMVRDPVSKLGSVSLSLVVMSSFLVVAGIIGKWSNKWGTIDIANALQFFYASCFLYFGRNIPAFGKTSQESPKTDKTTPDDPDAK